MPSKESIAVILGAIALGLSKKGSRDVEPSIENITERDLKETGWLHYWKDNQYLHGSSFIGDIHNPLIKRNPNHPKIFSQEQELETPDMGIYISKNLDTVLRYTKGNENRYVSIIEVNEEDLMIDEDIIGEIAYHVNYWFEYNKSTFKDFMPELYDNPKSPINIILKLYRQAMELYGHHKLKDMKYPLNFIERLDKDDGNDKEKYGYEIDKENENDVSYVPVPRLVILLGKRINFIMSEEERKILVKALMRGLLSSSQDDKFVDEIYRPPKPNFFIPDPENKGIKPIKIFRIIDRND